MLLSLANLFQMSVEELAGGTLPASESVSDIPSVSDPPDTAEATNLVPIDPAPTDSASVFYRSPLYSVPDTVPYFSAAAPLDGAAAANPAYPGAPIESDQPTAPSPVRPMIRHGAGWLLWTPALLAVLLMVVLPLAQLFFYSFTSYNVLERPKLVGMQNYFAILQDGRFWNALENTFLTFLVCGGVVLSLGWLFGSRTAHLPRPIGIGLGILFGIGSLFAFSPSWAAIVFSSDSLGLLNSLLGGEPVLWIQKYPLVIQMLILIAVHIAPIFAVFYIGYRMDRSRAAWHLALSLFLCLLLSDWMIPTSVVGYPSTDYRADWLPSLLYDYAGIRFEIGMAGALAVSEVLLIALLAGIGHTAIWLAFRLQKSQNGQPLPRPLPAKSGVFDWLGGGAALLGGLILLVPLLLQINYALHSIEELFRYPSSPFTQQPTGKNFSQAWEFLNSFPVGTETPGASWLSPRGLLLYVVIPLAGFLLFVLPTAAAIVLLPRRAARVPTALGIGAVALVPAAFWTSSSNGTGACVLRTYVTVYLTSPLLPLILLLTVWILRTSFTGCSSLTQWMHEKRRVLTTTTAILAAAFGSSLTLLCGIQPFFYTENHQFPFRFFSTALSGGVVRWPMSMAAALILLAPGILMVMALALIPLLERTVSRPGTPSQTVNP